MQQLGIDLIAHAAEIERLWREVIAEPPLRLARNHDVGDLPRIIRDLIEVSILHPTDLVAHERKVAAAVAHGERQRESGIPEAVIFEEFAALREALRRYLATCPVPQWKHREALVRLDMATSVAELAALRGYHRATYEQIGQWDGIVQRLARESPLLNLPTPT